MEVIIISKENTNTIISNLEYGQTLVRFEDDQAEKLTEKCVEAINEIFGIGVLDLSESDEYFDKEHTFFRILFRERNLKLPLLTMDDITLVENAENANHGKCQINFQIHEGLFKKAKKIASKYEVKFGSTIYGQFFSGQSKKMSIYKQLEKAHLEGVDQIEFTTDDIASQTLRVYVSQLNSFNNTKYSVSVENKKLIVYFKEKSRESEFFKKLDRLFNEYPDVFELNTVDGFIDAFKSYIADKKIDSMTDFKDHEPPARNVDGMKQHFIQELETIQKEDEYLEDEDF